MDKTPEDKIKKDSENEKIFNEAFDKEVKDNEFEILLEWWEDGYDDHGLIEL
ncbi:MAG: hypothetical protein MJ162_01145 [Treponema sp.]|nr:hypothetical protein [Treponema sp.]